MPGFPLLSSAPPTAAASTLAVNAIEMTDVSFGEWKVAVGSAVLRPLAGMLIATAAMLVGNRLLVDPD